MTTTGLLRTPPAAAGVAVAMVLGLSTAEAQSLTRQFELYAAECASCHGESMEGSPIGPALVGGDMAPSSVEAVERMIAVGNPDAGMPAYGGTLSDTDIRTLAILVEESRAGYKPGDMDVATALNIPEDGVETDRASFRIETVATGIDRWPFSIAPLPGGEILVTEKMKGIRIVSPTGELSDPVGGTPAAFDDALVGGFTAGLAFGLGWLLDIVPHPDYEENGWLYLHHTDRCQGCNDLSTESNFPVSMVRIARARIEGGEWVDQEIVWDPGVAAYTYSPDTNAGGRIAFAPDNTLYFSVGIKGVQNFDGIQDLASPYGKIHRIADDGAIPADNPFAERDEAMPSVYSLGHRNPQGMAVHPTTDDLWATEMGPRGGDEVNRIVPGGNYGWPLVSSGLNYDGTPVAYGPQLGLDPAAMELIEPLVDLVPAPALSDFVFYAGNAFPEWQGDMILGTLKARDLIRLRFDGDTLVEREVLLADIGRIRDVAEAPNGTLLLLIEHADGGRIVRMVPEN